MPKTPTDLLADISTSLSVPGIPPAPLSNKANDLDRSNYLTATEKTLKLLEQFADINSEPKTSPPVLVPISRSDEVRRIGEYISVAFSNAIKNDRYDDAKKYCEIAEKYMKFVSCESLRGYVESQAVYDLMAQGIQSLGFISANETKSRILDYWKTEMGNQTLAAKAIRAEQVRIQNWQSEILKTERSRTVKEILGLCSDVTLERTAPNPDLEKRILEFAKSNGNDSSISNKIFSDEVELAANAVIHSLDPKSEMSIMIDAQQHPIAATFFGKIRNWLKMAPELVALRDEGIQLVCLSMQVQSDKTMLKQSINSKLSKLPFPIRTNSNSFEVLRPQKTSKYQSLK